MVFVMHFVLAPSYWLHPQKIYLQHTHRHTLMDVFCHTQTYIFLWGHNAHTYAYTEIQIYRHTYIYTQMYEGTHNRKNVCFLLLYKRLTQEQDTPKSRFPFLKSSVVSSSLQDCCFQGAEETGQSVRYILWKHEDLVLISNTFTEQSSTACTCL